MVYMSYEVIPLTHRSWEVKSKDMSFMVTFNPKNKKFLTDCPFPLLEKRLIKAVILYEGRKRGILLGTN